MSTHTSTVATVGEYEIICTSRHTTTYSIRHYDEFIEGEYYDTLPEALRGLADLLEAS